MKKFLFLFFLAFSFGALTLSQAQAEETMMCTQQYAPVCGTVAVQCISAPCEPIRQTFGNACMAGVAKATNVTEGECTNPGPVKMSPKQALMAGTWYIKSFNGKAITSSGNINFGKKNTFGARLCNSIGGNFGATKDRLFVRNMVSTMMYCDTDIMPVENAMSFTRARYYVGANELKFITNKGDTFIWTR